jgi:hypothetical protein
VAIDRVLAQSIDGGDCVACAKSNELMPEFDLKQA